MPKAVLAVTRYRFIISLGVLGLVSYSLLITRIIASDSLRYTFLFWNLVLAAIPMLFAWWLVDELRRNGWLGWRQGVAMVLWVLFLPNSFYIVTDFIHLRANYEADLLFDITVLTSFMISGIVYGFVSVFLVHRQLQRRWGEAKAYGIIALILLAASFAICLGRYTRWNTWDVLLKPAGLLFDISDKVINPSAHVQTYQTTVVLFLVLFATYVVCWEGVRLARSQNS